MKYATFAERLLLTLFTLVALFSSVYKLSESPPTWFDEGIITQVAINTSHGNLHEVLQSAPAEFVSAGYVSTSYPVTYPIATALHLFGSNILVARSVMVLFLLLFIGAAYMLASSEMPRWAATGSFAVVATFAPLYGNGKNVLGEVPGLLFVALLLLCVRGIERGGGAKLFLAAGLFLGLAVSTKPIYFLLLLPVGIAFLCSKKFLTYQRTVAAGIGFIVPVTIWFTTQFNGEKTSQILAQYANPHGVTTAGLLFQNALGFFTHLESLYAIVFLLVWLSATVVRLYKKQSISRSEWIALGFTILVYSAYVRTTSYYRYFFPGEMLALIYFPLAVLQLRPAFVSKRLYCAGAVLCVSAVILFQSYQLFFSSWVADHYSSTRSAALTQLHDLPAHKNILLYNVPEAAVFLPEGYDYYQYLNIIGAGMVGQENLQRLDNGVPDMVLISSGEASSTVMSKYRLLQVLDRYTLWYKK